MKPIPNEIMCMQTNIVSIPAELGIVISWLADDIVLYKTGFYRNYLLIISVPPLGLHAFAVPFVLLFFLALPSLLENHRCSCY